MLMTPSTFNREALEVEAERSRTAAGRRRSLGAGRRPLALTPRGCAFKYGRNLRARESVIGSAATS